LFNNNNLLKVKIIFNYILDNELYNNIIFLFMIYLSKNNIVDINIQTILFGLTIVILCSYGNYNEYLNDSSNEACPINFPIIF